MSRVIDVEINRVNALITLGSMYRNAAEAIKEYVSNALDEWAIGQRQGEVKGSCRVQFKLSRSSITIDYNAPGMDEQGFVDALRHVVDSPKPHLEAPQIGNLGIGLWAFNQVGTEARFYSKKTRTSPTVMVTLRRNSAEAEFSSPKPHEERKSPGLTIVIRGLFQDPTKRHGPLSPWRLKHVLADRFDSYLRTGQLEITILCRKEHIQVEPLQLDLTEVGTDYREVALPGNHAKIFKTRFWFDPTGNGRISIRHTGVVVVDDLTSMYEYDMAKSIFSSGKINGFIDADFLKPLPARSHFVENQDLADFFDALRRLGPKLAEEIKVFQEEVENERLQGLFRRATRITREILSQEEFLDLDLIEGLNRIRSKDDGNGDGVTIRIPMANKGKRGNGNNGSNGNGYLRNRNSLIKNAVFENDLRRRSRLTNGTIEININSPDFLALAEVPRSHQLAYVAMLLGKEIIAYNDSSGVSDEVLEKMVGYGARVIEKVWK